MRAGINSLGHDQLQGANEKAVLFQLLFGTVVFDDPGKFGWQPLNAGDLVGLSACQDAPVLRSSPDPWLSGTNVARRRPREVLHQPRRRR
jgi:hypothetical protein